MNSGLNQELEKIVNEFEIRKSRDAEILVEDFMPDFAHPDYEEIAIELLRVDLEYESNSGKTNVIEEYHRRFPKLLSQKTLLGRLAFEDYRIQHVLGRPKDKSDYSHEFGINTNSWPDFSSSKASQCSVSKRTVEYPKTGDKLLDFQLVATLGEGSFAKVFLARQDSLANRFVALKVSSNRWIESDIVARMQHSNIVPIHSVHRCNGFQLVCMPFLGCTTLADVLRNIFSKNTTNDHPPKSTEALLSTISNRQTETLTNATADSSIESHIIHQSQNARSSNSMRLKKYNYVEACLWIVSQMAEGLAHAHECGIIHRDLKPANILISDDGRPMLLDFNLSDNANIELQDDTVIGGTLAYMSPGHLLAMRGNGFVTPQCDIFSFGVILYEMLTGKRPFPDRPGNFVETTDQMLADRQNPNILGGQKANLPKSIQSILCKCLAPNTDERYQKVDQLREDIDRQLTFRPLAFAKEKSLVERFSKWCNRHPKITSASFISLASALVIATLLFVWHFSAQNQLRQIAHADFVEFQDEFNGIRLGLIDVNGFVSPDHLTHATELLNGYQVETNDIRQSKRFMHLSKTEQNRLITNLTELAYLVCDARISSALLTSNQNEHQQQFIEALKINELALSICNSSSRKALLNQQARLLELQGQPEAATSARRQAAQKDNHSFTDYYLAGLDAFRDGRFFDSSELLQKATQVSPRQYMAWFALGNAHAGLGRFREATYDFTRCEAWNPESPYVSFNRGLCFLNLKEYEKAESDFDRVLMSKPKLKDAYLNRALAKEGQQKWREALADLNQAIDLSKSDDSRMLLQRSRIFRYLGAVERANQDFESGLRSTPTDESGWIARGMAQKSTNPEASCQDLSRASKINPNSYIALRNMAYVLSDHLGRTREAISYLDRIIRARPNDTEMIAARGVLFGRIKEIENAYLDADTALNQKEDDAKTLIHVACIYAQTSIVNQEDAQRALELLKQGTKLDPSWKAKLTSDPDLKLLHGLPEFRELAQLN